MPDFFRTPNLALSGPEGGSVLLLLLHATVPLGGDSATTANGSAVHQGYIPSFQAACEIAVVFLFLFSSVSLSLSLSRSLPRLRYAREINR